MTKNTKIVLGIAGALVAGTILGMMLAPEKGSDLRKKVKDKATDFADQIGDLVSEGKEKLSGIRRKVMHEANGLHHEDKM
ncbi:MAG: YtxH domain-containing protein [Chitinophagaceae bacterium]